MKPAIHPAYNEVRVHCALRQRIRNALQPQRRHQRGNLLRLPSFFTGKQKLMDTAGRVERFRRKYAKKEAAAPATPAKK